jgi:hypothetical protein
LGYFEFRLPYEIGNVIINQIVILKMFE